MVSVDDRATGPHSSESRAADHERLVLEPRDVEFDWTNLGLGAAVDYLAVSPAARASH